ncbi:MAG TPA: hypothetical protein VI122_22375 [Thermoleophilaceae bacterium]
MTESGFSGNPRYVLPAIAVASVLAGVGTSALVEAGGALPAGSRRWPSSPCWAHRFSRNAAGSSAPRRARWNAEWTLIATWLGPWTRWAAPGAVAAIGTATTGRALHSRLAWELGVPMDQVESVTDHRVVFRSLRERLNGRVSMRGRARSRRTLARVDGIWVYRRDGISFPLARREIEVLGSPFTAGLQGIHTSAKGERNLGARVVTR